MARLYMVVGVYFPTTKTSLVCLMVDLLNKLDMLLIISRTRLLEEFRVYAWLSLHV